MVVSLKRIRSLPRSPSFPRIRSKRFSNKSALNTRSSTPDERYPSPAIPEEREYEDEEERSPVPTDYDQDLSYAGLPTYRKSLADHLSKRRGGSPMEESVPSVTTEYMTVTEVDHNSTASGYASDKAANLIVAVQDLIHSVSDSVSVCAGSQGSSDASTISNSLASFAEMVSIQRSNSTVSKATFASNISQIKALPKDSQPLGGPKYYIVSDPKAGKTKVYHEDMPAQGGEFDVPDERGYEVVDYVSNILPSMSNISKSELPTKDSTAIGGPKYYIVSNTKAGKTKIYHEDMPREGEEINVPDERGYEVIEYVLVRGS